MRENIERILQFMASKRIRMHQITSKEVLEGNLKAVMRLILALAAHYKPQSVRHHDTSGLTDQAKSSNNDDSTKSNATNSVPTVEESTLNQTTEINVSLDGNGSNVKRSPSLNEGHYSSKNSSKTRLGQDLDSTQIYENFTSSRQQPGSQQQQQQIQQQQQKISTKVTIENAPPSNMNPEESTEKTVAFQREGSFVLQREGSFVRTGSGRKLPKIPGNPGKSRIQDSQESQQKTTAEILNTSLPSPMKLSSEEEKNSADSRKNSSTNQNNSNSKPKALEFWESMETVDRSDFRYNTIHRMSVGRRMLPKAPEAVARSHSLDRNNQESLKNTGSLNSSFSRDDCLDQVPGVPVTGKSRLDSESSVPSSPPPKMLHTGSSKMAQAPDGCSLQSTGSSAQPSQPSPPSSDSRGEVEGSSDNNSPPTSVIQGKTNQSSDPWLDSQPLRNNPAYDWLRGGGFKPPSNNVNGSAKLDEESLMSQLRQQRLGDGHSGSDSKHSDTMSDQGNIPYDILLQDLTQAKRQLFDLRNLVRFFLKIWLGWISVFFCNFHQ